jgi:predicted dehydrogenase
MQPRRLGRRGPSDDVPARRGLDGLRHRRVGAFVAKRSRSGSISSASPAAAAQPDRPFSVGLIGTKFMGRAHANAWSQAGRFFDLTRPIELRSVAGRNGAETCAFAERWGFSASSTEWRCVAEDPALDLVDVLTPNHLHAEMSIAALEAGRHVACEKPLAGTLEDARSMVVAAQKAKKRGVRTFVWFNYRRCPALAFAHQLLRSGRLGRIYHVRAAYLQDWGRAGTPLLWRFQADQAGSGAHGDLNAHIVDLARFLVGEEITEVVGAIEETFIKERAVVADAGGAIAGRGAKRTAKTGRSTVDDCVLFLARFASGAVASFEATRLATGNQNRNTIEVNGEKGSIKFDFERMNELQWWDDTLESGLRGWSRIMCTNGGDHPYAAAYWPAAHLIGYEHCFVSMAADIVRALHGVEPVVPLPDFEDAWRTQCVLEAAIRSARERRPVPIREVAGNR